MRFYSFAAMRAYALKPVRGVYRPGHLKYNPRKRPAALGE